MVDNLSNYSEKLEHIDTQVSESIKKALIESFEKNCLKPHDFRHREIVSQKGVELSVRAIFRKMRDLKKNPAFVLIRWLWQIQKPS